MAGGRLAKDVQYLQRHIDTQTNGQATVIDVDDNLEFLLLNVMPNDGFYKGAKLKFKIVFTECYPDEVPFVQCQDQVYHPNIDTSDSSEEESSNICVSLLDEWESSMGLDHIVMAILFLLYNPNPEDALSPYFGGDMELEELEENIRRTLHGETVEGVTWPCLLMDDVGSDNLDDKAKKNDQDVNMLDEKADSNEQDRESYSELLNSAVSKMADSSVELTENVSMESAQSSDSGPATGRKDGEELDLCNAASTSSCNNASEESKLDTAILNQQNCAVTGVVTPTWKDCPVICLDAADCDCKYSDPKCYADSLGIGRLLSCSGCRVSRIKALFSCFHRRDAAVQFQATNAGALCDSGDCDVD